MRRWLLSAVLGLAVWGMSPARPAVADCYYTYQHCCNCTYVCGYWESRCETVCCSPAHWDAYWVSDCCGGHWQYIWRPAVYQTRTVQVWHDGCWRCCG